MAPGSHGMGARRATTRNKRSTRIRKNPYDNVWGNRGGYARERAHADWKAPHSKTLDEQTARMRKYGPPADAERRRALARETRRRQSVNAAKRRKAKTRRAPKKSKGRRSRR